MAGNSDQPFWVKALSWLSSVSKHFERQAAIRRDARLKKYSSEISWVDGTFGITVGFERILAESEDHAQRLSNEQATKEFPLITSPFLEEAMVPPYVKDPILALSQWKVQEIPLTEFEIENAKKGELGPAQTSGASKAAGLANPEPPSN